MLMTHYREPIDFSVRKLEEAENTLRKWKRAADLASGPAGEPSGAVMAALCDDLGAYAAFQVLNDLAAGVTDSPEAARELKSGLAFLGFDVASAVADETGIARKIADRLRLIGEKNWPEADRIRDALLAEGIQLKDGKDAVTGERVTTWEIKR